MPGPGFNAPQIGWTVAPELQDLASKFAFLLVLIWIGYVFAQFAIPSRRRGMMNGQLRLQAMIWAAGVIVLLLDLALVPTLVNWILRILWDVTVLFGLT